MTTDNIQPTEEDMEAAFVHIQRMATTLNLNMQIAAAHPTLTSEQLINLTVGTYMAICEAITDQEGEVVGGVVGSFMNDVMDLISGRRQEGKGWSEIHEHYRDLLVEGGLLEAGKDSDGE